MLDRYDVIVSGAGPSGSRTAFLCCRAGLSVLLLDKHDFPREKCCAGGLLPRAEAHLDGQLEGIPAQRRIKGLFVSLNGRAYDWRFEEELGCTVVRSEFDHQLLLLAERSGCETRLGVKARRIVEHESSVEVSLSDGIVASRFMVIAEGTASGNATGLLGPYPRRGLMNAAAVLCEGKEEIGESAGFLLPGKGDAAAFSSADAKICAAFPIRAGLVISTVSPSSGPSLIGALEGIARVNGLVPKGKGCCHPIAVRPRSRLATRRCLAVGDCAGLASPFSGEGLTPSLASAGDAAAAIIACVSGQRDSMKGYEEAARGRAEREQLMARLTGSAVDLAIRGRWADVVLAGLERDPSFKEAAISVAKREDGARAFLLRMIPRLPALLALGASN